MNLLFKKLKFKTARAGRKGRGRIVSTSAMTVDGISVSVIRKTIKNIHLYVSAPDGRVRLSVPSKMSDSEAGEFIRSRMEWIKARRSRFSGVPNQYVSGEKHRFRGSVYTLKIIEESGKAGVKLCDASIELHTVKDATAETKKKMLTEWHRREMKNIVPSLLSEWEERIGVRSASWNVRLMKTRWGTCNPVRKNIWLSLELIKQPPRLLEYVIVHELVHLMESNHGKSFQALMDKFLPGWRALKKELNSHPEGYDENPSA